MGTPSTIDIYAEAPRLKEASLRGGIVGSMISLPWDQLTTLYIDREAIDSFFRASNLATCTIHDHRWTEDHAVFIAAVPPLEHLTLLNIVVLSTLHVTRAKSGCIDEAWPRADFHAFVQRGPNLQILKLDIPIMVDDLVQCLTLTPNLTDLAIDWSFGIHNPLTDDLIRKLHYGPTRLLPRLAELHFSGDLQFSADVLLDMVDSRCDEDVLGKEVDTDEAIYPDVLALEHTINL